MLMLPVNRQENKSVVAGGHMLVAMARVHFGSIWRRMTAWMLEETVSPRRVRKKKVLFIRRQLDEGTYSLNERLNLALDRLIEDLLTKKEPGGSDGEGTKRHVQEESENPGR